MTKKRLDKLLDRSIHVNMLLMMVAHPPVSKFLLSCLECSQYNDISVLKADKRFGCGESSMCNGVAGAFLIFYTAGIPTLLAFSLRAYLSPKAKKKYKGTPTLARAKARFGFTCGKYEAEFYAYEVLEMTRKFLLTGVSTMIRAGTYSQLLVKIVITFFFFMCLVRTTPFNSPQLDMLVCTTHFCTLMTLMGALMSKIGFFAAEGVPEAVVGYIMLAIQFFPLCVAFYIVGMAMRELHADKARAAKDKLKAKKAALKAAKLRLSGDLSEGSKYSEGSNHSAWSGATKLKMRMVGKGSRLSNLASSAGEPATACTDEELREMLKRNAVTIANMFKDIDEDGNGLISRQEFAKALPDLGINASKEQLNELFDEIDKDKSGEIDPTELTDFFEVDCFETHSYFSARPPRKQKKSGLEGLLGVEGELLDDPPPAALARAVKSSK